MSGLVRGLYETLVTRALAEELSGLADDLVEQREKLDCAEAPDRIALHISSVIRRVVAAIKESERAEKGVLLVRDVLERVAERFDKAARDICGDTIVAEKPVLGAIARRMPDGGAEKISRPLIPLLDTALLTNAPGEPSVGSQILTEIESSDAVDVVMAFVRRSGIRPLLAALRRHCENARPLRVLTTVYTGSTEAEALEILRDLGAEIRVSYDTRTTRLHAKAWLFRRESGFSTAYIGSSNLTHSAQVTGLEWNVRASAARNPELIDKCTAAFDCYWNSDDFKSFDADEFRDRCRTTGAQATAVGALSRAELRLYPFQEHLLERINLMRAAGQHRNLLVAATGTGKTVMAAVDYARLRRQLVRGRLLFVAHRKEILEQSLATFRHALRSSDFGELWVGGERPTRFEHVFASIQSLQGNDLQYLAADHFDVVVVDEFHHAAAPTYDKLLHHLRPRELLGLTATPERADGMPVLQWFGGRIAAELRLWDAIDQQLLVPFTYYGIHDQTDLSDVPWRRGRGYDSVALTGVLTANKTWGQLVVREVDSKVDDTSRMRALGFCVSVEHARFMAEIFTAANIRSVAVSAETPPGERKRVLEELSSGSVNVVFSVDLFNEGVDVPDVDTLLLLRPTDSPILFLQQLGRGLRRSEGKTTCTVLDFVGTHRKEFRFDRRFRALLGGSRERLKEQILNGFPWLPAGCHMQLDAVASRSVLQNIRESIPSQWREKVEELRRLADERRNRGVESAPTLAEFLTHAGLELEDVYPTGSKNKNRSWSGLLEDAGLSTEAPGPEEATLRRACGRLLHVDDHERIDAWHGWLAADAPPDPSGLTERERRLLRMLVAALATKLKAIDKSHDLVTACNFVWAHPQVRRELCELLDVLADRIEHAGYPLESHRDVPLRIHGRYSRIEILAAFGVGEGAKVGDWREGVRWLKEPRVDLLAFTLDKTSGHFSPTTRYRDYAISRSLIHWESQSMTRANSATGQRYQTHAERGSHVMLFARLGKDDRAFWFLGPATYRGHRGERPMAITWELAHSLPGDLFTAFTAAVA